ncbi:DNA polymerase kappa [Ceratocystis lukuohia]|uniref:DNA polymerase kappa n=1 Tax=Ceratocystis lukuohia TaxID=2019550 RepID=A0ABR4MQE3_9PEZI
MAPVTTNHLQSENLKHANSDDTGPEAAQDQDVEHKSLKYHLLGPSATKAGLAPDQSKISDIIYEASKGSKFFQREEQKDKILSEKIEKLKAKAEGLPEGVLSKAARDADLLLAELEATRDLSQHIVHVDCDAFFAAVEELDRPGLKDVPFAVGQGVLTTANYHARKFGCRSGMASFVAKKLCPHLILLPVNHAKYKAKAEEVRNVLADYDPRFESASIDEAYVNITAYCTEHQLTPEAVVDKMRSEVHIKTQITVSAGIAANARIAKICSNVNKPNGQFCVANQRDAIMSFIGALPTRKVNGIGRVLERELAGALNIHTCADLYTQRQFLAPLFGDKAFHFLARVYLGLGRTNVQPAEEYERKSVGTESTFGELSGAEALQNKLRAISEALEKDLAKHKVKGRTLVLKVKLHTFEILTRQAISPRPLGSAEELFTCALPILAKLQAENNKMTLRLMGLRCTNLLSTKKADPLAFFGVQNRPVENNGVVSTPRPKLPLSTEEEWEEWPAEELFPAEQDDGSMAKAEACISHTGSATTKTRQEEPAERDLWDCPICFHPQQPEERSFNEHIDLCLSRQTIRDAVEESSSVGIYPETVVQVRRRGSDKKRGRSYRTKDPKQKKLCF